jgi:predicted nucleotidyltransferase
VGELADRKLDTVARILKLREQLEEAESIAKTKACVYATGSFGRLEASPHSDLDLFIVGKSDDNGVNLLKRLDEICIKADLIEVTRKLDIPEFSGDGRYLVNYSVSELTRTLGTPKDDVENTFTARLLLLLESQPLLEKVVYTDVTRDVIAAYWRDYEDHRANFMPAFLANDILRLWRTFCVNYEARTERVPDEEKAKGKLKNYKLKHSRLLTCYSALLYLLAVYRLQGTVSPPDAIAMINMTPTGRLQWLLDQSELNSAHAALCTLLERYEVFLQATNAEESQLIRRFMDKSISREYMDAAYKFGDTVYQALTAIGNGSGFQRLLIV